MQRYRAPISGRLSTAARSRRQRQRRMALPVDRRRLTGRRLAAGDHPRRPAALRRRAGVRVAAAAVPSDIARNAAY